MIRRVDPVRIAWETLCATAVPVASVAIRLHPDNTVVERAWDEAFPKQADHWSDSVSITAFSIEELVITFH